GTAFIATHEAFAHDYHKQRLVAARSDDAILSDAFHINWPLHAPVRVLANSVTAGAHGDPFGETRVIGDEEGRPIHLFSTDSPLRSMRGDFEAMALYAGQGVGAITRIDSAGDVLLRIANEAAAALDSGAPRYAEPAGFASPPCFLHELGDARFAGGDHDALIAALNVLLEAERAGARVAMRTAAECEDPARKSLVVDIQRDEARWCGVLTQAILRLGGTPSRRTGDFHDKAMAIPDVDARLAFLNRGQQWVVKRLRERLAELDDDILRGELTAMLDAHVRNIDRVQTQLDATTP
ncbi:MAG TPA: DUF6306 domain-containing protein, partial [Solimonas sp.]|nr:DUF6306 domain-containing protein [Solimonas sp.]